MKKSEAIENLRHKRKVLAEEKITSRPSILKNKKLLIWSAVAIVLAGDLIGLGYTYRHQLWPAAKPAKTDEQIAKEKAKEQEEADKLPPKLNPMEPPGPAPAGMVWIPGGEFHMGLDHDHFPDSQPVHKVYVDGFWMDKYEVNNDEFARFVEATSYVTVAEQKPDPKDFPRVPASELVPFSIVFKKPGPKDPVDLRSHQGWWDIGKGACWKHPEGPQSSIKGREKHPVVHICYDDALAYCNWAKKRLPTEAEWEFAARGGLDRKFYAWGDELTPGGKWMANIWQGNFPYEDKQADGFHGTAPGGSFPPNGYGLYEMAGNVWEWCADWYQPDFYGNSPERNPKGPNSGFDPLEQGTPKRVQRGGSFLCADNYCVRYVMGSRGKGEPSSAQNHMGFRCVKDPR